jgi:enoyl-CoA hydratase/carnithine racemase
MTRIDLSGPLPGLRYERRDDGIALITLLRPDRGNSLLPSMQPVMRAIWSEVRDDPALRVAIVTAAGERHFCTGFDVG